MVARLGFKKALVVTDKGLMQFGVAKMVLDVMDEADQAIRDVCTPGNPREVSRDDIVALYRSIL